MIAIFTPLPVKPVAPQVAGTPMYGIPTVLSRAYDLDRVDGLHARAASRAWRPAEVHPDLDAVVGVLVLAEDAFRRRRRCPCAALFWVDLRPCRADASCAAVRGCAGGARVRGTHDDGQCSELEHDVADLVGEHPGMEPVIDLGHGDTSRRLGRLGGPGQRGGRDDGGQRSSSRRTLP